MTDRISRALPIALVALFVAGASRKLNAPLTYWDAVILQWGLDPNSLPLPAGSSPFFVLSLRLMGGIGWLSVVSVRWLQAGGAIFSGLMTFLLANRLWGSRAAGGIAVTLYLLHPIVIQGTQSLDMADASFLPGIFSLWILGYLSRRGSEKERFFRVFFLSALLFGWKITSSLGLLFIPAAAAALPRAPERPGNHAVRDGIAAAAGFLAFALIWWRVRNGEALAAATATALYTLPPKSIAQTAFHASLGLAWLGPFLALLSGAGTVSIWNRLDVPAKAAVIGLGIYTVAYLFIGGMNYAFPRYHAAVLPLVCALAVNPAFLPKPTATILGIFLVLCATFWFLIGDPIYELNYRLREAFLERSVPAHLFRMALLWLICAGVLAAMLRATRTSWQEGFLLSAFAYLLVLGIIQGRAPYVTAYNYGEEGRTETIEWVLRTLSPGSAILSPPNLSLSLMKRGFAGGGHLDWRSRETVSRFIARTKPKAVVLGLTENSRWQLRWLLQDPPAALASCRNRYLRIGSYRLCLLGDNAPKPSPSPPQR